MIQTPNNGMATSLVPGARIGKHAIRHYMGADPVLGDRYAAVFGTTNRVYDINVAATPGAEALRDYEDVVRLVGPMRHPCLIPYFACGEDDGYVWLRSEHTDGAPDWTTASVAPASAEEPDAATAEEPVEVCFPTLQALLDAAGGKLAAKDRNTIVADLAEALAFLHARGSYAGDISPTTVFLDRTFRHASLIARLRFYAFPEEPAEAAVVRNLRQAGEVMETLLKALVPAHGAKLDKALDAIARRLLDGGYADGAAWHADVRDALEDSGASRPLRLEHSGAANAAAEESAPASAPSPAASSDSGGAVRRHRSSHHRHKKRRHGFNANSSTGQMLAAALRMGIMFTGIVGVGVGVFLGMKYLENRQRAQTRITSAKRYSAITIIDDKPASAALEGFPDLVADYSMEQLRTAADLGDAVATARLALLEWRAAPNDPELRVRSAERLRPQISALEALSKTDPVAAYWLAYARLVGLDGPPDSARAIPALERAVAQGHTDAGILLGDWHADRGGTGVPDADRLAMNCWRAAFGNPAKWTQTQFDAIARIVRFVREGRGHKADDADLARLLESAAVAGHSDSILLVSELYERGHLVEKNEYTALSWLRRIGSNDAVDVALRAEAQRRMADMFLAGRGTPASASAARIWYERAAKLGNAQAMLALAGLCESGVGAEGGRRTPDEARYWRDKAAAVKAPTPSAPDLRYSRDMLPQAAKAGEGTP